MARKRKADQSKLITTAALELACINPAEAT